MDRDDVAKIIQKNWNNFATTRKQDSEMCRKIAGQIGRKITDYADFQRSLYANKVIVQANGTEHCPMIGHSAFIATQRYVSLNMSRMEYISSHHLKNLSKYETVKNGIPIRSFIQYNVTVKEDTELHGKISHLIDVGRIFVLDEPYANNFWMAFRLEFIRFKHRPFAYGLHYNCNTFVACVLQRVLQLTESPRV